jgi:hypothetical protein
VRRVFQEQTTKLRETLGADAFAGGGFSAARKLIEEIVLKHEFTEFMTLAGYEFLD